ncbi:MAG: hypothetical protein GX127_01525 [Eubacteriaceae bacterium]|jgi:hypothetical protein|nr:hypothetical protein [Eubacteriaceae bacterium]
MSDAIKKDGPHTIYSNDQFDVKVTPKIFGGYRMIKTLRNQPLKIIETRDIRLPLSDKAIQKEALSFLEREYPAFDPNHYNIQPV